MSEDELPESDRIEGAPHPRDASELIGQGEAEAQFLEAFNGDRLHHAWLITGPKGVGKATLAWRIAKFLLTQPMDDGPGLFGDAPEAATSLDTDPEHPIIRRMRALSEPSLMLIRRAWNTERKRLNAQIVIDDVRKLGGFFGLSSADGRRRVVIVDSVDDMNVSAANALLKVLEEPPKNAILLLVSHNPARLLPTIRSRCRELRAKTLSAEDIEDILRRSGIESAGDDRLARLAGGSAGEAIRLIEQDGPALYDRISKLVGGAPQMDRQEAQKLAEWAAARGMDERLDVTVALMDRLLADLARAGAGIAAIEDSSVQRLSPSLQAAQKWAEVQQIVSDRIRHGRAVNVDAQSLLMDALLKINDAAPRS